MNKLILIAAIVFTAAFTAYSQSKVKSNGKYGLNDPAGDQILPNEYDQIVCVLQFGKATDFSILKKGNRFGL